MQKKGFEEEDLKEFQGIILSPVNREPNKLRENVPNFREKGQFDIVLDPQLYVPRGQRDNLIQQPYFPDAFDTTDFSVPEGWAEVVTKLAAFSKELGVNAVASPVSMPRRWTDEYYDTCVETSNMLSREVTSDCRLLTTCLVSLSDLDNIERVKKIASILSRHDTGGYYVVVYTEVEPRRELSDASGITSLLMLVSILQQHAEVTVAYSSSDMILFKSAGANNCCTSKFFNLRRFTILSTPFMQKAQRFIIPLILVIYGRIE